MHLTFLGKESQPNESPTLFATDRGSYVVQGWIVTDPEILAVIAVSDDETIVEVPAALMAHLAQNGLSGDVVNLIPPIVRITENGNYIIKGSRGLVVDRYTTTDRGAIELCRTSFEEVWKLSIPHSEYRPN